MMQNHLEAQAAEVAYAGSLTLLVHSKTKSKKPTNSTSNQSGATVSIKGKPIEESNQVEGVGENKEEEASQRNGKDQRKQVLQTEDWPYSVHGLVAVRFRNTEEDVNIWGTGTLIAPNVVLTAAHNLYNHKLANEDDKPIGEVIRVRFFPAINGQHLPFEEPTVKNWYYPKEYVKNKQEDYGLLILGSAIGNMTGYFGLHLASPDQIRKLEINVTGYPGIKVKDKDKCYEMWGMNGSVNRVQNDCIIYDGVHTSMGQSGSAVWYQEVDNYFVVGVHVRGDKVLGQNEAILLTKPRYDQIRTWIKSSPIIGRQVDKKQTSARNKYLSYSDVLTVNFYDYRIASFGIEEFVQYDLCNLRKIVLHKNYIGNVGAETLSKGNWPHLEQLFLFKNNIEDEGVESLSKGNWPQLSALDLHDNRIGDAGAQALSRGNWPQLSILDLRNNRIGDAGIEALSTGNWPGLKSLLLSHNIIGNKGVAALSACIIWLELEELDLGFNRIEDEGAGALFNGQWPQLQVLDLCRNNIKNDGLKNWKMSAWSKIKKLHLNSNKIGNAGVEYLIEFKLESLEYLCLYGNDIQDGRASNWHESNWPQLRTLDLRNNRIGDVEAEALSKGKWPELKSLLLSHNAIGNKGVAALSKKWSLLGTVEIKHQRAVA